MLTTVQLIFRYNGRAMFVADMSAAGCLSQLIYNVEDTVGSLHCRDAAYVES